MQRLDHNFYEQVVIYKALTDDVYLSSIVDHIKVEYFNDKAIQDVVTVLVDYYNRRGEIPTIPEIRSYMINNETQSSLKKVVECISQIKQTNINQDELYDNTERFLREKAVYNTLLSVADDCNKQDVDTSDILDKFDKACGISLTTDLGFDLLNQIDEHIEHVTVKDKTVPTGWEWLDEKLDGGLLEDGRALYVFAGETNVGKSIVLGNVALNIAATGKKVLIVSLEMSEKMYSKRLILIV